jgi:hypothetical protein
MPAAATGGATVWCNGTRAGRLAGGPDWATTSVELPAAAARAGVNWITFRWPVPAPDAAACWAADAAALARGEFPSVLPVFGEIFHATLSLAG